MAAQSRAMAGSGGNGADGFGVECTGRAGQDRNGAERKAMDRAALEWKASIFIGPRSGPRKNQQKRKT